MDPVFVIMSVSTEATSFSYSLYSEVCASSERESGQDSASSSREATKEEEQEEEEGDGGEDEGGRRTATTTSLSPPPASERSSFRGTAEGARTSQVSFFFFVGCCGCEGGSLATQRTR